MPSTDKWLRTLFACGFVFLTCAHLSRAEAATRGAWATGPSALEPFGSRAAPSPQHSGRTGKRSRRRPARRKRARDLGGGGAMPAPLRERGAYLPPELRSLAQAADAGEMRQEGWHYHGAYRYWLQQSAPRDRQSLNTYRRAFAARSKMSGVTFTHGLLADVTSPRWEFLGPRKLPVPDRRFHGEGTVSGRVNALAYDPNDPNVIYLASAGGGFWKSTNGGRDWVCLSDGWENVKFSSVAVHPTDPKIVIAGTGDYQGAQGYGYGLMMFDGVKWENKLRNELEWYNVSQILFDPDNPRIITVTAGRHPQNDGKILRSVNGGETWRPANIPVRQIDWNNVQVSLRDGGRRYYYAVGVRSAGHKYSLAGLRGDWGCGGLELWRSPDSGESWTRLNGPPVAPSLSYPKLSPCVENVDVAPSPTSPRKVYLLTANHSKPDEAQAGQVWAGDGVADRWTEITRNFPHQYNSKRTHADNWSQSSYDFYVKSARHTKTGGDVIYVGLIDLLASTDEGKTWRTVGDVYGANARTHADQHALAVNPRNPNDLLVGNDGGVYRLAFDPDKTSWKFQSDLNAGLGMTMFYRIAVDPSRPDWVLGGAQDNATPVSMGNLSEWSNRGLHDGGFCAINPNAREIQYATSQELEIYRTTDGWKTAPDRITENLPWSDEPRAFIAPIALDPTDSNKLYAATSYLWRWDEGPRPNWTPRLGNQALATEGGWVSYIAVAPKDGRRIYTGSSKGDLWMTEDGGDTWRRIDNNGLPSGLPALPINSIAVHPTNPDSILVAFGSIGRDSHLWRCDNTRTVEPRPRWRRVGADEKVLESVPLYDVVFDPHRPDTTFYVAGDLGVFVTDDAGRTWANLGAGRGLPNVRVSDLEMLRDTRQLYVATYGRGVWRLKLPEGDGALFFKPADEKRLRPRRTRRARGRRSRTRV
ncbi:MAG TPA: hypothetical protein VGV38_21335 [Pyrinomonadaceae bacterium]|nr:hypothetical protein [Pyrinomonadaceae bacterium]